MLIQKPVLNEQQLQMLNLFKRPMPDEDFKEIKRAVVKVLSRNIDAEMTRLEKERNWNENTYENWGKEHMRPLHKK